MAPWKRGDFCHWLNVWRVTSTDPVPLHLDRRKFLENGRKELNSANSARRQRIVSKLIRYEILLKNLGSVGREINSIHFQWICWSVDSINKLTNQSSSRSNGKVTSKSITQWIFVTVDQMSVCSTNHEDSSISAWPTSLVRLADSIDRWRNLRGNNKVKLVTLNQKFGQMRRKWHRNLHKLQEWRDTIFDKNNWGVNQVDKSSKLRSTNFPIKIFATCRPCEFYVLHRLVRRIDLFGLWLEPLGSSMACVCVFFSPQIYWVNERDVSMLIWRRTEHNAQRRRRPEVGHSIIRPRRRWSLANPCRLRQKNK